MKHKKARKKNIFLYSRAEWCTPDSKPLNRDILSVDFNK